MPRGDDGGASDGEREDQRTSGRQRGDNQEEVPHIPTSNTASYRALSTAQQSQTSMIQHNLPKIDI